MANQAINLGSAPTGAGGDTFRSAAAKINENFSNPAHAASREVGLSDSNVMPVGAFGLGRGVVAGIEMARIAVFGPNDVLSNLVNENKATDKTHYFVKNGAMPTGSPEAYGSIFGFICSDNGYLYSWQCFTGYSLGTMYWRRALNSGTRTNWSRIWNHAITTVDSNGFLKQASPIVQLYAEKIEINEEAIQQNPVFEKINTGHYLIKNTKGFSDNGWYIEMPKDANGNVLVAVQYQQLEDNTIEVKTFSKKFDEETGDIIPNIDKPRDIPVGRWIDLRLKELPKPEIEVINEPEQ